MRNLAVLFLHLLATVARLAGPGGARSGVAESVLDLRGEPKRDYTVQIRGGVGETVVHLPRDVAIAATATNGIGDISIEGLENRDGLWVNPDRIGGSVTVRLNVKGGIGRIRLIRSLQ